MAEGTFLTPAFASDAERRLAPPVHACSPPNCDIEGTRWQCPCGAIWTVVRVIDCLSPSGWSSRWLDDFVWRKTWRRQGWFRTWRNRRRVRKGRG